MCAFCVTFVLKYGDTEYTYIHTHISVQFSSVQSLSRVRLFATPWTAALQASLSITNSRVYPDSCPLSRWCHPTISSPVIPFSSCLQSFPASGSFPMGWLFASSDQSIYIQYSRCFFNLLDTVQFSHSVVSNSLRPHESQHSRPPCPSPTPGVHPNSCPSSRWCHLAISSLVVPFSSCPQSLPASESFPVSQLFAWGGQSIGVSALASFLPKNTKDWSPLEWTGWISL